ncbi:HEAT repeat domain-containing protein [Mongoliitalea daihaiensis]|uniref:HEAT repeat domain-containing protein n=1 Tax=Mongoliitalea daihaiensis TaxID=2782006 RepID=UPI001F228F00|nr:HEAT repeat domain-containing protein [Mongoliitalea daihaiensis]UJP64094.1 HEAT repeat domain-containing protein [Mongoliitalea daihaiensis]
MKQEIDQLLEKMCDKNESEAYLYSDKLAKIGGDDLMNRLLPLMQSDDTDTSFLAARTLSAMENNGEALKFVFDLIHQPANKFKNGYLVQLLEGFDLTDSFVDLYRIFLFGNFKSSSLAKEYLDTVEFDITPRVLKKAEKHWNHFLNNVDQNSGEFLAVKVEAEQMLIEIKEILES